MKGREQLRRRQRLISVAVGSVIVAVVATSAVFVIASSFIRHGVISGISSSAIPILRNPTYVNEFTSEIAHGLHRSVAQVQEQIEQGKTMPEIAAAQGISASQLHTIELNAFQHIMDKGIEIGNYSQQAEDQALQKYRGDPSLMDHTVSTIFSGGSTG